MKIEQYNEQRLDIIKTMENRVYDLQKEFAFSNNTFKVGDIIKDHIGYGKIIKILYTQRSIYSTDIPECVYMCQELTAKLEPKKRDSKRHLYQINIIK